MPLPEVAFENSLAVFCDEAAARLSRLRGERVDARWSLAEADLLDAPPAAFIEVALRLSTNHLSKLENGMLSVPMKQMGVNGTVPTARAAMGLFILTAFAFVAREHASQGTLWPFVKEHLPTKLGFHPSVLAALFDGGEKPSPCEFVKSLLRTAVQHFPVKNAIDIEGKQQWYLTVHLQYGFSDKHFEEAGDRWLAGVGLPHSVELLLGHARFEGVDLASDRFRRFWNVLRAFHYGELGLERARAEMISLGWMGQNRAPRLLTAVGSFDQRRASVRFDTVDEPEVLRLCDPVLYRPFGSPPVWLYGLHIPQQYPLHRDEYSVQVSARKVGRIVAVQDRGGTRDWKGVEIATTSKTALPTAVVAVPLHLGPWREPSLMGEGGASSGVSFVLTEEQVQRSDSPLLLSRDQEDPAIWRVWDGQQSVSEAVLAIPPALANSAPSWTLLGLLPDVRTAGWRHLILKVDLSKPLCLTIGGQVVWECEMADRASSDAETLQLQRDLLIGDSFRLVGAQGVVIRRASCAGTGLAIEADQSIKVPISCFGDAAVAARVRLDVTINNAPQVLYRTVRFPTPCLRVDTQSGVRRIGPDDALHVSDFNAIRFWHPDGQVAYGNANCLPYLFEGRRPVMPAKDLSAMRGHRLQSRLAGFGEPVFFGKDLIPDDGGRSRTRLAKQAVACGILNGEPPLRQSEEEGGGLLLEVEAEDIEPRPDWRVEVLTASGQILSCSTSWIADLYMLQAKALEAATMPAVDQILCVRVVIDGCVRGRWERPRSFARLPGTPEDRWRSALSWELAIFPLSAADKQLFVRALLDTPEQFMRPWSVAESGARIHPLGQPGLIQRELLRRLLGDVVLDAEQAGRLCDAIAEHRLKLRGDDPKRLIRSLADAASITPSLPWRLIEALGKDRALRDRSIVQHWKRETIAHLRDGKSADAFEGFVLIDADPLKPWKSRSPIALASVDPGFVDATIQEAKADLRAGRASRDLHRENLDALCELTRTDSRLARYVATKMLE
jgi:hypothetical protein